MASTRIAELAASIQENTRNVDEYLQRKGLPSPSFDEDGPVDFKIDDEDIQKAREVALESSLELHELLLGPALLLRPVLNGVSLQAIYKYDIASKVPVNSEISFADLASTCDIDETNLRRILRFAMAFHHVFQEPRKGHVAHSAASRKLAEDPLALAGVGYMFDEVWQSFAKVHPILCPVSGSKTDTDKEQTIEAKKTFMSDEPNKSGWSLSQHTNKSIWEHYAAHPEMAKRFAGAISAFADGHGNSPSFLVENYPWSSIGNGAGTVIDVGGSRGNVSIMLAQSEPNLKLVVQDLPHMIRGADDTVPAEVAARIVFMAHDFFTEQSVKADVYLFRNIFHNWADSHVIKILKATIPALRPGARIVVNDYLISDAKTMSSSKERSVREMDMIMLSLFNSREREEADWRMLFHEADKRFKHIKIWMPEGATLAIIEAVWED